MTNFLLGAGAIFALALIGVVWRVWGGCAALPLALVFGGLAFFIWLMDSLLP